MVLGKYILLCECSSHISTAVPSWRTNSVVRSYVASCEGALFSKLRNWDTLPCFLLFKIFFTTFWSQRIVPMRAGFICTKRDTSSSLSTNASCDTRFSCHTVCGTSWRQKRPVAETPAPILSEGGDQPIGDRIWLIGAREKSSRFLH